MFMEYVDTYGDIRDLQDKQVTSNTLTDLTG